MKRLFICAAALLCLAACSPKQTEQKVLARYVPERMDDFVWENEFICYRAYGKALEGNPTSPGFDIWVKLPGKLVADEWYKAAQEDENYYHHDHGGKDCYKVSVSLGGGASAPLVDGELIYPATNWRSYEILESTPDKAVFVLHYPAWEVAGKMIALDKKITVKAGSYFCEAEDSYTGDFDSLTVAAGFFNHGPATSVDYGDRFAIWEPASDQSIEPEDGMIGVAIIMPEAEEVRPVVSGKPHIAGIVNISNGEKVNYLFGSCWSKGDIKTSEDWFRKVLEQ